MKNDKKRLLCAKRRMICFLVSILKMVISMNSVLKISFFFLSLFLLFFLFGNYPEKTNLVMSIDDTDNSEYQVFTIYTDNLTTKNFSKYFSNTIHFLGLYPKINPIYKDRLGKVSFSCNSSCNLEKFVSYYKQILEKNHFRSDLTNISYYGVPIEKIKIYASKEELAKILENCSICTIKEL